MRYWWESQKEGASRKTKTGGWIKIKMDLREIGWGSMDWIGLSQVRDQWRALMNTVMKHWFP
jgi:hypothetical protein